MRVRAHDYSRAAAFMHELALRFENELLVAQPMQTAAESKALAAQLRRQADAYAASIAALRQLEGDCKHGEPDAPAVLLGEASSRNLSHTRTHTHTHTPHVTRCICSPMCSPCVSNVSNVIPLGIFSESSPNLLGRHSFSSRSVPDVFRRPPRRASSGRRSRRPRRQRRRPRAIRAPSL